VPPQADPGAAGGADSEAVGYRDGIDVLADNTLATLFPTVADYEAEGQRHRPPESGERTRNRARGQMLSNWAAVYWLKLKPIDLLTLTGRANKEADSIRRKKKVRTRAGLWTSWLNRHMAAMVGAGRWASARAASQATGASVPPGPG
jgi:hypothetical protein